MVCCRSAVPLLSLFKRLLIQQLRDGGGGYRRHLAASSREWRRIRSAVGAKQGKPRLAEAWENKQRNDFDTALPKAGAQFPGLPPHHAQSRARGWEPRIYGLLKGAKWTKWTKWTEWTKATIL